MDNDPERMLDKKTVGARRAVTLWANLFASPVPVTAARNCCMQSDFAVLSSSESAAVGISVPESVEGQKLGDRKPDLRRSLIGKVIRGR